MDERCVPASSTVSSNTSCSQLDLSKLLFEEYFIQKQRDIQGKGFMEYLSVNQPHARGIKAIPGEQQDHPQYCLDIDSIG